MSNTTTMPSVGTILVDSWGYSMTIVNFYQVVRVTAKHFYVKEIKSIEVSTGFLSGESTPKVNEFVKEPKEFQLKQDAYFKENYKSSLGSDMMHYLQIYNGKPKYFNHCD